MKIMRYHFILIRMAKTKRTNTSVSETMEKMEHSYNPGGNVK